MLYLNASGTDDNVNCGAVYDSSAVSVITVCGWVDLDETTTDSGIWDFGDGTHHFVAYYNNAIYLGVNYPARYLSAAFTNTGKAWLCFTDDGTDVKLFVDNSEVITSGYSTDINLASQNFIIGRYFADLYSMNGKIWDVRVYNRALSADERKHIFTSDGADTIVNGLLGRWLLNDLPDGTNSANAASECKDMSGNGKHGTPTGTPVYYAAPASIAI